VSGWGDIPWGDSWDDADYTFGGVLRQTRSVSYTFGGYLKKRRTYTFGGYVTDPRGSFRGIGMQTQRDALDPKYAGDTFLMVDETNQQHGQFWTGAEWIESHTVRAQESGQSRRLSAPTTGRWRAEVGDSAYPFQYTDGSQQPFAVDAAGNVLGRSVRFGTSSYLQASDVIDLPAGASGYATPVELQKVSATGTSVTSIGITWAGSTVVGSLLVAVLTKLGAANVAVTPPGGWTAGPANNITAGVPNALAFYKLNASAGESNPSFSWTGAADATLTVAEWSNIQTTAALDGTAATVQEFVTITSVTTSFASLQPTELAIAVVAAQADHSAPQSGFSLAATPRVAGSVGGAYLTKVLTSQGTTQTGTTLSTVASAASILLRFRALAVPVGTPANDYVRLYGAFKGTSTTSTAVLKNDAGVSRDLSDGMVARLSSAVTLTNTTTEADILTYDVAPNTSTVGTVYRCELWGLIDNQATSGILMFRIRASTGATFVELQIPSQAGAATGAPFHLQASFTLLDASATGSYWGSAHLVNDMGTTQAQRTLIGSTGPMIVNNTSGTITLKLAAKWNTASVTNILVAHEGYIMRYQ
jgi:hypothetical protein